MAHVFAEVGAELKSARRAARITEKQMATRLKVLPQYVKAIEKGNYKAFTSVVYAIGHVRSYAGFVGLEAEPLCRRLRNSLTSDERKPEYNFITNRFARREFSGRLALAAVTILAIGYGGWYMFDSGTPLATDTAAPVVIALDGNGNNNGNGVGNSGGDDGAPPSVTTIGEPDAGTLASRTVIADTITTPRAAPDPAPLSTTTTTTPSTTTSPAADEEPVTIAAATPPPSPAVTVTITEDPSLPVRRPDNDATAPAPAPEQNQTIAVADAEQVIPRAGQAVARYRDPLNEIVLRASAVSWVEITRADGSALAAWLMRPGDEYTVPGEEDFYLTTGNAGGLAIEIGGGAATSLGEAGETINELPLDPALLSKRY